MSGPCRGSQTLKAYCTGRLQPAHRAHAEGHVTTFGEESWKEGKGCGLAGVGKRCLTRVDRVVPLLI